MQLEVERLSLHEITLPLAVCFKCFEFYLKFHYQTFYKNKSLGRMKENGEHVRRVINHSFSMLSDDLEN